MHFLLNNYFSVRFLKITQFIFYLFIGKRDIIMDSQLPAGMDAQKLRELDLPHPQEAPAEDFKPQPPKFITQIQPLDNLQEGDSAHFECRLEPTNDPKLRVEWYHNGKPLKSGKWISPP